MKRLEYFRTEVFVPHNFSHRKVFESLENTKSHTEQGEANMKGEEHNNLVLLQRVLYNRRKELALQSVS